MKYTKKQIKEIWDLQKEYSEKIDKISEWLEELIDGYAIIDLPHPIEVLSITDPELYEELSYVLYEVPNMKDWWLVTYPDGTEIKVTYDYESLLKLCEKNDLLVKE